MNPYIYDRTKDLNDDNIIQKVGELLSEINTSYLSSLQIDLMFIYHNRLFKNQQEHTKGCASCRGRVYNKLKDYYDKNINPQ
jgi:hypothetical protein